jgi:hypothetical protein
LVSIGRHWSRRLSIDGTVAVSSMAMLRSARLGLTARWLARSGYQRAAGRLWAEPQIRDAWAAGLWVRLFNAKKDAADGGGPQLDRLAGEVSERLALATGSAGPAVDSPG